jgi:2,4-dienoyl-CoA reductase (NADPH2)
VKLNKEVSVTDLYGFDSVVLATGVTPREVKIPVRQGTTKVNCVSYVDVLTGKATVGNRVAVIGAGGIGYDVSEFLTHDHATAGTHAGAPLPNNGVDATAVKSFLQEWGVDSSMKTPGGLLQGAKAPAPPRKVYLLQRKSGKLGMGLGKTTGWIHRTAMKRRAVEEMSGCKYLEISDEGLKIDQAGKQSTLAVDTVVICAGQEPLRDLAKPVKYSGQVKSFFLIGGALRAGELDAKRAIDQGTRLGAAIETAESLEVFEAPEETGHMVMKMVQNFMGKGKN